MMKTYWKIYANVMFKNGKEKDFVMKSNEKLDKEEVEDVVNELRTLVSDIYGAQVGYISYDGFVINVAETCYINITVKKVENDEGELGS